VLAVGGDALVLQVAQVGGDGPALHALELDHPRLDDNAPCPVAHAAAAPGLAGRRLPAAVAFEVGSSLAPAAPRIEAPARLAFARRPEDAAGIAALLGHSAEDLGNECPRSRSRLTARLSEQSFEFVWLIFRHAHRIGVSTRKYKGAQSVSIIVPCKTIEFSVLGVCLAAIVVSFTSPISEKSHVQTMAYPSSGRNQRFALSCHQYPCLKIIPQLPGSSQFFTQ